MQGQGLPCPPKNAVWRSTYIIAVDRNAFHQEKPAVSCSLRGSSDERIQSGKAGRKCNPQITQMKNRCRTLLDGVEGRAQRLAPTSESAKSAKSADENQFPLGSRASRPPPHPVRQNFMVLRLGQRSCIFIIRLLTSPLGRQTLAHGVSRGDMLPLHHEPPQGGDRESARVQSERCGRDARDPRSTHF